MSKATTPGQQLATLLESGTLQLDDLTVTFMPQAKDRLVIGFLTSSDGGGWLRDVCADAGFSLIALTANSAQAFTQAAPTSLLKAIAKDDIATTAKSVSLCGNGDAGMAAMGFAVLFANPFVVAFDPSNAANLFSAKTLQQAGRTCQKAAIFYDPFFDRQADLKAAFAGDGVDWLKSFALRDATLNRLWRMKHLPTFLPAALLGALDTGFYYQQIRNRKNYRFYRTGMEAALAHRGKTALQQRFRAMFRAHLETKDPANQFERLKTTAAQGRPANADAWIVAGRDTDAIAAPVWPSVPGNVWNLQIDDSAMRYLSDRWQGVTIGFEERAGVTLAQTPPLAIGMISFGQGAQVERQTIPRFPWHVVGPDLNGKSPFLAPMAEATLLCARQHQTHSGLSTIMGFTHPAPGLTENEATRGMPAYDAVITAVQAGAATLSTWGKSLFVDRVRLALLSGAPQSSASQAATHYGSVAQQLSKDIPEATNQTVAPAFVVIQSAGSRSDGTSEVILAEGQFDLDNPTLKAIVASPSYPWPLMDETPATHSADASLIMDELAMLAVDARQEGKQWFCPSLRLARRKGRQITAEFATMAGLKLHDGPHGFHIICDAGPVPIAAVAVTSKSEVTITLASDPPQAPMSLAYAWGHQQPNPDGKHTANHGALRDNWEAGSAALPDQTLYRYALAARIAVQS